MYFHAIWCLSSPLCFPGSSLERVDVIMVQCFFLFPSQSYNNIQWGSKKIVPICLVFSSNSLRWNAGIMVECSIKYNKLYDYCPSIVYEFPALWYTVCDSSWMWMCFKAYYFLCCRKLYLAYNWSIVAVNVLQWTQIYEAKIDLMRRYKANHSIPGLDHHGLPIWPCGEAHSLIFT